MRAAFVAVLFVLVAASGIAQADGFVWTAPAGCPTASEVRERIDRRLAEITVDEVGDIDVTVTRSKRGFAAAIDTRAITVGGRGRTLTARRCDELADAVAVVVARLASDAPVVKRTPEAVDDGVLAVVVDQETPPRADVAAPASRAPRERWNGGMRALALSGIGMTPHIGIGGDLAGFVQRDDKFVELGYARWVERPRQMFPGDGGTVEFGTQLLAIRGGWASQGMPLRAWGGLETGTMNGVGAAFRGDTSGRWIAIAAGFGVGWPMSPRTRLVGTFEVAAPLQRATFTFMDGTEISEPAPLSARSALGLEVTWH